MGPKQKVAYFYDSEFAWCTAVWAVVIHAARIHAAAGNLPALPPCTATIHACTMQQQLPSTHCQSATIHACMQRQPPSPPRTATIHACMQRQPPFMPRMNTWSLGRVSHVWVRRACNKYSLHGRNTGRAHGQEKESAWAVSIVAVPRPAMTQSRRPPAPPPFPVTSLLHSMQANSRRSTLVRTIP